MELEKIIESAVLSAPVSVPPIFSAGGIISFPDLSEGGIIVTLAPGMVYDFEKERWIVKSK
ncbi:hypothetical protein [Leptospira stimsonii]|uniref:Uncharacterized protein n=1 Tax=Leptospira stimsonii TaxID=2202203 RepID=A0ABY2NBR8_9LEPT|nr:hypothetical protein [Leptospira stimsonii]TGK10365.1 hypothetical protein EHO98_22905 [Leptospira stimsonii]TGM20455.1 hypothetical protein EHQ90_02600 [Leptospira stimsonii]